MGDSGKESGLAQALVQQRLAVAAFSNRLTGEAPYSTGAQDVKAAVRRLSANAGASGLGPSKVRRMGTERGWMDGHHAGGHRRSGDDL
jgi:acetyl esterase/lipase